MITFSQLLLTLLQYMSPKYPRIFSFPDTPYSTSSVLLDDLIHLWNLYNPIQTPSISHFPLQNIIALLFLFIFLFCPSLSSNRSIFLLVPSYPIISRTFFLILFFLSVSLFSLLFVVCFSLAFICFSCLKQLFWRLTMMSQLLKPNFF